MSALRYTILNILNAFNPPAMSILYVGYIPLLEMALPIQVKLKYLVLFSMVGFSQKKS